MPGVQGLKQVDRFDGHPAVPNRLSAPESDPRATRARAGHQAAPTVAAPSSTIARMTDVASWGLTPVRMPPTHRRALQASGRPVATPAAAINPARRTTINCNDRDVAPSADRIANSRAAGRHGRGQQAEQTNDHDRDRHRAEAISTQGQQTLAHQRVFNLLAKCDLLIHELLAEGLHLSCDAWLQRPEGARPADFDGRRQPASHVVDLKHRQKHKQRIARVQVRQPRVSRHADDQNALHVRRTGDADELADGITRVEQRFSQTCGHDRRAWMRAVVRPGEITAGAKRNVERAEIVGRDRDERGLHLYGETLNPHGRPVAFPRPARSPTQADGPRSQWLSRRGSSSGDREVRPGMRPRQPSDRALAATRGPRMMCRPCGSQD